MYRTGKKSEQLVEKMILKEVSRICEEYVNRSTGMVSVGGVVDVLC